MGPQKQSCQSKAQGRFSAHVCIHAARLGSLNIIVAIRLMLGHMMQQMQREMAAGDEGRPIVCTHEGKSDAVCERVRDEQFEREMR